jgi:hypothetical protein
VLSGLASASRLAASRALGYAVANHASDSSSACASTVSVADSCWSGG